MVIYTIYHINYICAITNLIFSFGANLLTNYVTSKTEHEPQLKLIINNE